MKAPMIKKTQSGSLIKSYDFHRENGADCFDHFGVLQLHAEWKAREMLVVID